MFKEIIEKNRPNQNVIEVNKLFGFVNEISPKVILQVGVENGNMLTLMDEIFRPELLLAVENNVDKKNEKAEMIYGDVIHMETYQKVLEKLGDKKIDFLFLSHDRTEQGLLKEHKMFSNLVRKGGIIAIDCIRQNSNQYSMAGIETWRVWTKIILDNRIKYYEFWDVGNDGYGPGIGMYYQL